MHQRLSANEIPTGTGTRLKTHIREYESILKRSDLKPDEQAALQVAVAEIRRRLIEGQAEDEILRGSALRYCDEDRTRFLVDLKRTAARLKGEADSVRAKVV
jgi:hypothetical protein